MRLFRGIGLSSATFLVIGNIVGAGIFTTSGLIAEQLGPTPWLIGVWVLGGALALMGAACYSLLGVRMPKAGGEYAFLYPTFGPLPAFLSGWASLFVGFAAPIAASSLALTHYLRPYLPPAVSEDNVWMKVVSIVVLLTVGVMLSFGLRSGSRLHSTFTVLHFSLTLIFALMVLSRVGISENLASAVTAPGLTNLNSVASAFILVMFTYSGWNAAAYVAEEIRCPERNIPASLILGTVSVILLYILINLAYLAAAPLSDLSGQVAVGEITARAVFGTLGHNLVNVLIIFSILSSLTAMSIAGPRVYFAMARDKLFPAWLGKVHPVRRIPLRSIWFQTMVAVVLVSLGNFREILVFAGFILILFSTLTVATLFKISDHRLLPAAFVVINTAILFNALFFDLNASSAGLAVVAAGIPVFMYYRSRLPDRLPSSQ